MHILNITEWDTATYNTCTIFHNLSGLIQRDRRYCMALREPKRKE